MTISYNRAWNDVEKVNCNVFGDYLLSFKDLRWYVGAMKTANPGTVIDLDRRFIRMFVSFHFISCMHL